MRRSVILFTLLFAAFTVAPRAQRQTASTIDQLISIERLATPAISPNGESVAYVVRTTNWDDNTYHNEIWLADVKSGQTRQLTNNPKKSSTSPAWSPDDLDWFDQYIFGTPSQNMSQQGR